MSIVVFADVEMFAKKNPKAVLKNLEMYLIDKRKSKMQTDDEPLKFDSVCDFDD